MKLKREEFTIEDSPHKMYAEGKTDDEITFEVIRECLRKEYGYKATNIDIWWDDFMKIWQWNCDISKIDN